MGPFQGMSDRVNAAEALTKYMIIIITNINIRSSETVLLLTCVYCQHVWIIDTINSEQITKYLRETNTY